VRSLCKHCGSCNRYTGAECQHCGEQHCDEHYYVPDLYRSFGYPAAPDRYLRWGLSSIGAGCKGCLEGWARSEEDRLNKLLPVVVAQPDVQSLQSLSGWPDGFQDRIISQEQAYELLLTVARMAGSPNCELVEVKLQRRIEKMPSRNFLKIPIVERSHHVIVNELSRRPAFRVAVGKISVLASGAGEFFCTKEMSRMPVDDRPALVVTGFGMPVEIAEYIPGETRRYGGDSSRDEYFPSYFLLKSGSIVFKGFIDPNGHWRDFMVGLADVIPC
jgi:hypothetical protein